MYSPAEREYEVAGGQLNRSNLRFVMSSRKDSIAQSPEALEQQVIAIILTLHLQLESLETAVAELRRCQQKTSASGKQG